MVKKIKLINLTDDNLNESEAMSKVVEEMKNEAPLNPIEPVVMKKKTKPNLKIQPVKTVSPNEIVVNFDSHKTTKPIEDIQIEVKPAEVENKNFKTTELVKCDDCGKMMTLKSLKYSHKTNCPVNKKEVIPEVIPEVISEVVLQTKIDKKPKKEKPEKIIEQQPEKLNNRNERMMSRIRKIENLALQAFFF
jgi:hypothetical protein